MADFYEDMAQMAREILAPTSKGGLGQGVLAITSKQMVPGTNEWDTPTYETSTEVLDGAVRGVSAQMVSAGQEGSPVILGTDWVATCTPPKQPFKPSDTFTVDGKPVTVVQQSVIPAAGTPVAVRFILRG